MSTLKVTHLQNENGTGPAMSLAVGGGVTFAGITTFHSNVELGSATNLQVGTGATISGSTNTITALTNGSERLRITSAGNVGIGSDDPQNKLDVAGDVKILDNSPRLFLYDANATGASNATGGFEGFDKDGNKNVFVGAFAPDADNLIFGVTGSERARITSGGSVGIGNDDPDELLEVGNGTVSGALKVSGQSSSVTSDGFTVDWESSSDSTRLFSEPQSGGSSQFKIYTTNSGTRSLAATINSSGNLVFPDGQGIDFSASAGTGIASGGGVLDDYEEGTFTPTVSVEGAGGNAVTDKQYGRYVKVGKMVTVWCYVQLNGTPTGRSTSAAWQHGGLPFVKQDVASGADTPGPIIYWTIDSTSALNGTAPYMLVARLSNNTAGGRIRAHSSGSNQSGQNASLLLKDNTEYSYTFTYEASA